MSRIKGRNTNPEIVVRSAIHRMGFRFRLHDRQLPGTPDLVLPRWRTVIFVHGCYWHRHSGCKYAYTPKTNRDFWLSKFAENVDRDRRVAAQLKRQGWTVLTLWECQALDPEKLTKKLLAWAQKPREPAKKRTRLSRSSR